MSMAVRLDLYRSTDQRAAAAFTDNVARRGLLAATVLLLSCLADGAEAYALKSVRLCQSRYSRRGWSWGSVGTAIRDPDSA